MPEKNPITYAELPALVQGYADALINRETNSTFVDGDWANGGPGDFAEDTLRKMVEDCSRFYALVAEAHPLGELGLGYEIGDYYLGWYFYLERQETGVGFRDLLLLDDLVDWLDKALRGFGTIAVERRADGKIVFPPHELSSSSKPQLI